MSPPLSPLERPAQLFAVRPGPPQNETRDGDIPPLQQAFESGATGIAVSAACTSDGVVVVTSMTPKPWRHRRAISRSSLEQLSGRVVPFERLTAALWPASELLVEVNDPAVLDAIFEIPAARALDSRLWVASPDMEQLAERRALAGASRLLVKSRVDQLVGGPERAASNMRDRRLDGLYAPRADWTGGLTTLLHRFGRLAVSQSAPHQRMITAVLRMGVDAVASEYPDRLAAAAIEAEGLGG